MRLNSPTAGARLIALLAAVMLPTIGFVVLVVITAVSGVPEEHVDVDIARVSDDEPPLEDLPEESEEPMDIPVAVDVPIEVAVEVPTPDETPLPPAPVLEWGEEFDRRVIAVQSPVLMKSVAGKVKMHGLRQFDERGFGTLVGNGGDPSPEGCLLGSVIDFKSKADGSPRLDYDEGRIRSGGYWQDVRSLLNANFSPASLARFAVPPKRVALSHLFIEKQDAANGPRSFGVDAFMQPKGFAVYYSGKLKSTEKARYRFVGYFDDFLIVRINRKVVLEDDYGGKRMGTKGLVSGWSSTSPDNGKWPSIAGVASPLTVGDWFEVDPDRELFVELVIGERQGGTMGGVLLLQKYGETYPTTGTKGRPTLPVFASRPLTVKERERLRNYSERHKFKLGLDIPRFNLIRNPEVKKKLHQSDIPVSVDI